MRRAILAVAIVLGCRRNARLEAKGDDAAPKPITTPAPLTPEVFCDRAFADARVHAACRAVLSSKHVVFHADLADACLGRLMHLAKDGDLRPGTMGTIAECAGVVEGTLGERARCAHDEECSDGMICDHPFMSDAPLVCHRRVENDRCAYRIFAGAEDVPSFAPRPDCDEKESCVCDAGGCACGP